MAMQGIEPKSLGDWFEGRELPLILAVGVITASIGFLVHHGLASIVLSAVEFAFGVLWWIVRRVFRICDGIVAGLGQGARELEQICGILTQQGDMDRVIVGNDPKIVACLRDIAQSATHLADRPHGQSFVQHALDNTAQLSSALVNRAPFVFRPKSEGEHVQRILQTYMHGLPSNFVYETLTTLGFWCNGLLADPLAALQMNVVVAAKKSGKIFRVILTEKAPSELTSSEWKLLETHLVYTASNSNLIETRILYVPKSQMKSYGHFAISKSKFEPIESLLLELHYTADGRVERLEVIPKEDLVGQHAEVFRMAYTSAIPIAEFFKNKPPVAA